MAHISALVAEENRGFLKIFFLFPHIRLYPGYIVGTYAAYLSEPFRLPKGLFRLRAPETYPNTRKSFVRIGIPTQISILCVCIPRTYLGNLLWSPNSSRSPNNFVTRVLHNNLGGRNSCVEGLHVVSRNVSEYSEFGGTS